MIRKASKMLNKKTTNCEECENYIFDEETEEYYCEVMSGFDEDEYASISRGAVCPMFRFNDEYRIVRKQN